MRKGDLNPLSLAFMTRSRMKSVFDGGRRKPYNVTNWSTINRAGEIAGARFI